MTLLIFVGTGFAALFGAWLMSRGREWYQELERPAWAPAAPVLIEGWLAQSLGMAIAAWLVFTERGLGLGVWLWVASLVAAVLFPVVLFVQRRLSAAFTWICLVWVALALTTAAFWVFSPIAGVVMGIVLGWTTYLGAATFFLWQLNQPSSH